MKLVGFPYAAEMLCPFGIIFDPALCDSKKFMLKILLCLWFSMSVAAGELHPLHVSVTEINYDQKDKALEIMIRIFVDDLETTMRKRHALPELDILNPKEKTLDALMTEYLDETFSVSLDGKKQSLNYLGNERDGEAFIFYVEVPKVRKWNRIAIANSVLTEIFEDQSNLVHVTFAGNVLSLRLNKSNPSGILTFQN